MSAFLNVFNKPVDLEAVDKEWKDPPIYRGRPRQDGPVDVWLGRLKDGCKERKLPKSVWHLVGERYLHSMAKKRYQAVQKVMANKYNGEYVWNWKKFKIAMLNMQWELDSNIVQTFLVRALGNVAWILGPSNVRDSKRDDPVYVAIEKWEQPALIKAFKSITNSAILPIMRDACKGEKPASGHQKAASTGSGPASKGSKSAPKETKSAPKEMKVAKSTPKDPKVTSKESKVATKHVKSASSDVKKTPAEILAPVKPSRIVWKTNNEPPKLLVRRKPDEKDPAEMSSSQVPIWLLQACSVLDNMAPETKATMTILSAILITVGSIPAMPAVQAGAAGAFLASGAAQTIGGVVAGFGAWLGTHAEHMPKEQQVANGTK